jgi:sulfite exporter TauE/SafE/copper chaperone CopZ
MKSHTLHVPKMHCQSCVILTETELQVHPSVHSVKAHLHLKQVEIHGDFGDKSSAEVAQELTPLLEKFGYHLTAEAEDTKGTRSKWADFKIALPIALVFIAIFVLLQKMGIVNLVNASSIGWGTAFVIGVIASLSTCMAVVGGLVLSVSASFAKEGNKVKPQLLFHLGRLLSFFILGGVIGSIGSAFQLGAGGTFILGLIVGIIMLILGLNLLDLFHWSKRLTPTMPKFISKHIFQLKEANHTLTPMLLGIATFFLPCGFTQSMQIYTLSTGNFWNGAMTMFIFALGTLPVLAILSFSSLAISSQKDRSIFFKTAGLVVLFFGLFNLLNSFVAIGWLPPVFNI